MLFTTKLFPSATLLTSALLLVGCVGTGPNVVLKKEFWDEQPKLPVTVALDKSSKAELYRTGLQGFLDVAISMTATQQFRSYLEHYNFANFHALQSDFIRKLHKQNIIANKYKNSIEVNTLSKPETSDYKHYAMKDFKPLRIKLKNNRLLLLNINRIGAVRSYYSMIPLGAPRAICNAEGRLINLEDNTVLWRFTTHQEVSVSGEWDQPPGYPNFTVALNKAVHQAKEALLKNFFYSAPQQEMNSDFRRGHELGIVEDK